MCRGGRRRVSWRTTNHRPAQRATQGRHTCQLSTFRLGRTDHLDDIVLDKHILFLALLTRQAECSAFLLLRQNKEREGRWPMLLPMGNPVSIHRHTFVLGEASDIKVPNGCLDRGLRGQHGSLGHEWATALQTPTTGQRWPHLAGAGLS
jgi:hypothetical protein